LQDLGPYLITRKQRLAASDTNRMKALKCKTKNVAFFPRDFSKLVAKRML